MGYVVGVALCAGLFLWLGWELKKIMFPPQERGLSSFEKGWGTSRFCCPY